MTRFIGREEELETLNNLWKKGSASFVVIRGRRRIGKSRLIYEFGKSANSYIISGTPPSPTTSKQEQIDTFLTQVADLFNTPKMSADNWGTALWLLSQQCQKGKIVLAIDEISWIASKDKSFLGHLKNVWDLHLSHNPNLVLIACGSVSSWIEDNILKHTGFVGRITYDIQLKELPIRDSVKFWGKAAKRLSSYELFKVLSVTGGIPRYLEEIDPSLPADKNLQHLCFTSKALLFREYDQIFSNLFLDTNPKYTAMLEALSRGPRTINEMAKILGIPRGSSILRHIHTLIQAGFVTEQRDWNLSSGSATRLIKYRLSDNYIRFYLRCIKPNHNLIMGGMLEDDALPGWHGIMGLQFENLVLNNIHSLLPLLNIKPSTITHWGPYLQTKTARKQGCQIDLLIQTRYRTLYCCEIKFSQDRIGMEVAPQINLQALKIPKGWSIRPVLIHVNGATEQLRNSETFDYIIDFGELANI